MSIQGRVKVGPITKKLVNYLCNDDIAVIRHNDIDELAAAALVDKGVRAVINTGTTMTGHYKAAGAMTLLLSGVPVIDSRLDLGCFNDYDLVTVVENDMIINGIIFKNSCSIVDMEYVRKKQLEAEKNEDREVIKFICNTISHAQNEYLHIVGYSDYPDLRSQLEGRHVVVVVRNKCSSDELKSLKSYIESYHPVFIAVDGGADLILNLGYIPDILIGDMDSVSDIGIYRSREIILHAYDDGCCPCLGRILPMNVPYSMIKLKGTSEDAALMLAYRKKAQLIVLVGGHSCMYDFLDKGREGMSSTFVIRTLVGERLVDCKGLGIIAQSEAEGKEVRWAKI